MSRGGGEGNATRSRKGGEKRVSAKGGESPETRSIWGKMVVGDEKQVGVVDSEGLRRQIWKEEVPSIYNYPGEKTGAGT